MKRVFALLLGLCLSAAAMAHSYKVGEINIVHPWSRAMPAASTTGGVYFALDNKGKTADRLVGAATPRAETAELHTHVNDNGVMRMRKVEGGVEVAPGQQVKFAPGGYHVMLFGLKQPLKAGDRFPMTLKFEKGGEVKVDVVVQDGADSHSH
ncbi:hypothetical protein CEK28_01140 [Xenophilus sp. AP218F]|nr:copper chaperone PCu(A)C [Chromobacterium sp. ASV5]OWY40908.1 hypothetical protein CEK28_01140 [Xenophilus sp. AP218F]